MQDGYSIPLEQWAQQDSPTTPAASYDMLSMVMFLTHYANPWFHLFLFIHSIFSISVTQGPSNFSFTFVISLYVWLNLVPEYTLYEYFLFSPLLFCLTSLYARTVTLLILIFLFALRLESDYYSFSMLKFIISHTKKQISQRCNHSFCSNIWLLIY